MAVRARLAVRMEEETARPDGVEGFWAKELFAHPDLPPPAARSAMVAILRSWETWTARGWGDLASCFTSGTLTHDDQVAWAILGPEGVLEALARAPGPGASTYVYSLFRRARIAGLWEPTTEQVGRLLAELQHPETRAGVLTTFVPAVASPRTGSRLS